MTHRTLPVSCVVLLLIVAWLLLPFRTANCALALAQNPSVQRDVSAEQELASRLVGARSEQDRQTILSEHPALIDVALRKSLVEQAEALRIKGKSAQALTAFEVARQVAEQIHDQTGVAEVSNSLGNLLLDQGKRDPAMERYQKGLELCTTLAEKSCMATALLGIGNVYNAKNERELAIDFIKRALTINQESASEQGIFRALIALGNTYLAQGDYAKALETYQQALPISESAGNSQRLAMVSRNIGLVYRLRGEAAAAIESFQKSAELYEKLGDQTGVAAVNTGIGIVHSQRGDYSSAMHYFQKCLEAFEKLDNKKGVADSLGNIGIVLRLQGNYNLALEYQQKSLALSEAIGEQQGVAHSLNNLGIIYMHAGDYAHALETYQKSLKLNETLGNKSEVASVFNNLGVVYREQGAYDLALETFRKSLQLREQLGEKGQTSNLLRSIGIAYQLKGDPLNAATYSERAAALAREVGFREVLASALTTAGNAYLTLGQTEKSRAAFAEAIATVEALRGQVAGGEQDQQRFFEGQVSPYYRMVELLTAQGNPAEALAYAERGKARLLLDVLKSGRVRIEKAMTVAEREQEQKIRDSFVLLNSQIAAETRQAHPDPTRLGQVKAQLEAARLVQQEFQTRLYAAHSELQVQRGDVPQFKPEDAAALGADTSTALLEYVVTDNKTYLFVLTRATNNAATDVKIYAIPVKRKELATQVEAFREKVASHNLLIREPARLAYDLLLKPAQALLRGKSNLIIVPDDVLWELPFQALQTESNRYLIEQSAISYAPSLTVLREMTARLKERPPTADNSPSLLALGNPALGQETIERARSTRRDEKLDPLPEAEREVQTLARLYGPSQSEVFIGAEAREDRAKTEAGKFRVLHFATHGVVNNVSPMYSHLVLSQGNAKEDGLLEAWELLSLDLKADLVVLSACETARGRVGAGEGMIGLSWALFVAGTPTAVVSQWKVDSASTTELMLDFHRNRLAANSKAQSLRKAMLKMLGNAQYKHPFYWAPFVVIGDAN